MSRNVLVPELYVTNLSRSLSFYLDLLGFTVEYQRPEKGFAALIIEGARLMLEETSSLEEATQEEFQEGHWRPAKFEYPFGRGVNFEFNLSEIKSRYARLQEHGYPIKLPLMEKWYRVNDELVGVHQFLVMDPDGYLIRLSQYIGKKTAGERSE